MWSWLAKLGGQGYSDIRLPCICTYEIRLEYSVFYHEPCFQAIPLLWTVSQCSYYSVAGVKLYNRACMQFHKLFSQSGNEFVLTKLLVVLFIVIPKLKLWGVQVVNTKFQFCCPVNMEPKFFAMSYAIASYMAMQLSDMPCSVSKAILAPSFL